MEDKPFDVDALFTIIRAAENTPDHRWSGNLVLKLATQLVQAIEDQTESDVAQKALERLKD